APTQPAASQPTSAPATGSVTSFVEIVAGEPCGNGGGKTMYLVNKHDSKLIKVKVRRSWTANGKPATTDLSYAVKPGQDGRKQLGCSSTKTAAGEVRTFGWTVVEASFAD